MIMDNCKRLGIDLRSKLKSVDSNSSVKWPFFGVPHHKKIRKHNSKEYLILSGDSEEDSGVVPSL